MKRYLGFVITALFFAAPMLVAQESNMDHVELGAFVNYYRLSDPGPTRNFLGLGGRVAFGIRPSVQLEAEMAYDFKRDYTSTFNNGVSTSAVTTRLRTLHGFFGPKFQTGSGAFRAFISGKVGFDNFSVTGANAPAGFTNAVGLGTVPLTSHSIRPLVSKPSPDRLGCDWKPETMCSSTMAHITISV